MKRIIIVAATTIAKYGTYVETETDSVRAAQNKITDMTKEEIVTALLDDMEMPYLQDWQARDIVNFVIKNYKPSLPSNLDEAADRQAALEQPYKWEEEQDGSFGVTPLFVMSNIRSTFKAGVEWVSGQGITKEITIGMATEKIIISVSEQTLNELDLCPGDKIVVQIRKK